VQVTALYELIASFGPSDDYSYAYLMAWGLFIGQSIEVLLSAYLWVRENYILHNPVRFTISAIVSRQHSSLADISSTPRSSARRTPAPWRRSTSARRAKSQIRAARRS